MAIKTKDKIENGDYTIQKKANSNATKRLNHTQQKKRTNHIDFDEKEKKLYVENETQITSDSM